MRNNKTTIIIISLSLLAFLTACSSSASKADVIEKQASAPKVLMQNENNVKIENQKATDDELIKTINVDDLIQLTEVLEYSNKNIDALSLVNYSDSDITVSADNGIDLSALGLQTVTYILDNGITQESITKTFNIIDTRAPNIVLDNKSIDITAGENINLLDNIHVSDNVDGDLPYYDEVEYAAGIGGYSIYGYIDVNTPGKYYIDVIALDKNGLESKDNFEINVIQPTPDPTIVSNTEVISNEVSYVANMNTNKFHYPNCRSVSKMKESNKWYITTTRDYLISIGYSPCGNCHP